MARSYPMQTANRVRQSARQAIAALQADLEDGTQDLPDFTVVPPVHAGGPNHCPNSDLSYSKAAAEAAGTLPGDPGDDNHEAWRWIRQPVGNDVDLSRTLKAVGSSGWESDVDIPDWDRENGWIECGSEVVNYDVAVRLFNNVVHPGETWRVVLRLAMLNTDLLPEDLQLKVQIWEERSGGAQGPITGGVFTLTYFIHGTPGTTSADYYVIARTASGLAVKSNILTVPNCPDVLSAETGDYVTLFMTAGPGFIEFNIYKDSGGVINHINDLRNSADLTYHDTGVVAIGPVTAFPDVDEDAPQAIAQTEDLVVAPYLQAAHQNEFSIDVPSTYDSSQTVALYLRLTLTGVVTTGRSIQIDKIFFGQTFNEWSPDPPPFFPGPPPTFAIPSIAPTQGNPGGGGGVFEPPAGGTGGGCVAVDTPVKLPSGRVVPYSRVKRVVAGERGRPYAVLAKPMGTVAGYLCFTTGNGIYWECSQPHGLYVRIDGRKVAASRLRVGQWIDCETRGRRTRTKIKSIIFVPCQKQVGTFVLRDLTGRRKDGHGVYLAGRSKTRDKFVYMSNVKPQQEAQ